MAMKPILYSKKVALGSGIIGGIVGGSVMYEMMSMLMTQIGMGANCFAIIIGLITGQPYENALYPGMTAHFLTSIAIGIAFGAIINVKKLQIHGFGKGIGLGVAAGVIAFAVIFVPIAMTVLPAHMMDLMKMMPVGNNMGISEKGTRVDSMNGNTGMAGQKMNEKSPMDEKMKMEEMNKMMMGETQKLFPMILAGALVSHIAFGAVLGAVITPIVKRSSERSG